MVPGRSKKPEVVATIQRELVTQGLLEGHEKSPPMVPLGGAVGGISMGTGLSFAEQRELLAMQIQLQELQTRERHLEREARLELERVRQSRPAVDDGSDSRRRDNLGDMVRLLPKFNERDPDVFFSLFESLADERSWYDADRTALIQSVPPLKAQEAYLALDPVDRKSNDKVKAAILLSYELCAEAYRLRFRNWRKTEKQTYVEVTRELVSHFKRWREAAVVKTLDDLCEVLLLEQFKNITPESIVNHLNERKPKTALEAAKWADEFVLTNKGQASEVRGHGGGGYGYRTEQSGGLQPPYRARFPNGSSGFSAHRTRHEHASPTKVGSDSACNYCLGKGHWKKDCPVLKGKRYSGKGLSTVRPQAMSVCQWGTGGCGPG